MKANIIICTLFLTLGLVACKGTSKEKQGSAPQEAVPVTVASAIEKIYEPILQYAGTAEANKAVNLSTAIPGRVEKLYYRKGSFVPQGACIARLSDEMLVQAEVEYNAIKKDYERIARLREQGSVSVMDFDHIKAKYEASQAKVNMLRKNTSITAPFAGVITDIMVEEGETASVIPTGVSPDLKVKRGVVTLMQLAPLKVRVQVNEKELSRVAMGVPARIAFDAYPTDTIVGKVVDIDPVLNPTTRTTMVEIQIPNPKTRYKPGMYCRVSLRMPEARGVFIPMNAIHRRAGTGESAVYVLSSDTTVKRVVVVPRETIGDLVHVDELASGDRVVLSGKNKLSDGSTIKIVAQ